MIFALIIIGIICLVLIVNTITFKPVKKDIKPLKLKTLDEVKIMNHLSQLIQKKTISRLDPQDMDMNEFESFKKLLEDLYPKVHEICEKQYIGPTGILYKWKGRSDEKPVVLMSHYDVVPVDEESWTHPPFSGRIIDDVLWGRGTLDTKTTLLGVLEAAETQLEEGFIPSNDIYFSFAGDEETSGQSAPAIVTYLKEKGIRPYLVLDEGGIVTSKVFPGVSKPTALIGIGEKGYLDLQVLVKSQGGHAAAPPNKTIVSQVAAWIQAVDKNKTKAFLTEPVLKMFDRLGRHSSFFYRMIFSNLWLFSPVLKYLFSKTGGQMNALIRTTTTPTILSGSDAFNVLPTTCEVGFNCRILNTDTVESTQAHIVNQLKLPYECKIIESREASKISPIDTSQFELIEDLVLNLWPGAVVSPYLMTAATDSRHFCDISDHVMRFAPMEVTSEELSLIHSHNERIRKKSVMECVQFYCQLIERL